MAVRGMICADCERQIADALVGAGARSVQVDFRRAEVLLDPANRSEAGLRDVVEELGYPTGELRPAPSEKAPAAASHSDSWGFLLFLLPAVCCGAPLLLAAVVASGAGAWLVANRLMVGAMLAATIALVLAGLWGYRSGAFRK